MTIPLGASPRPGLGHLLNDPTKRRVLVVVGCLLYLGLALLLCREMWSPGLVVAGGPPDNEQKVWEIGWWAFSLTHGLNPLYTTYLSPAGHPINLMWNNSTPLLALLAVPLTLLVGAVTSFNLLVVLAIWLDASVAFLCLRALTPRIWSAWLGGLLFGFSPFVYTQLNSGRLPWLALFLLPVMLVLLRQLLVSRPRRRLLLGLEVGLVASAQLLLSEELLATSCLMVALTLLVLAIARPGQVARFLDYSMPVLAIAAATALAICGYPLWMQFFGPGHAIHGSVLNLSSTVSVLSSFLVPTQYQAISLGLPASRTASLAYRAVSTSYLGLPLLVLASWAAVRGRGDLVTRVAAIMTVGTLALSMGPWLDVSGSATGIPLPWVVLAHIPLLRLAAPQRLMVFAYLGLAVVVARAPTFQWTRRQRLALTALGALSGLALAPASAAFFVTVPDPGFFGSGGVRSIQPGSELVVAPSPISTLSPSDAAMIWQVQSDYRFRMTWASIIQIGQDGHAAAESPPSVLDSAVLASQAGQGGAPTSSVLQAMRAELHSWDVAGVIVGPSPHEAQIVGLFQLVLRTAPKYQDGVYVWSTWDQPSAS